MTKVLLSLLALLVVCSFVSLGVWQHGKSQEKARLQQADARMQSLTNQNEHQERLSWLAASQQPTQALPIQTTVDVRAWGRIFAVDNQQVDGRVGVVWYQSVRVNGSTDALVELGFQAYQQGRYLPPINAEEAPLGNMDALLKAWPGQGMALGGNSAQQTESGAALFNQLRVQDIEAWLGHGVLSDRLLVPTKQWRAAWYPKLNPVSTKIFEDMPPERHLAYAFQWFAMATAVAIIWLIMMIRSRKKSHGVSV